MAMNGAMWLRAAIFSRWGNEVVAIAPLVSICITAFCHKGGRSG